MSEPIVYVDQSEIREGKLDELKPAMVDLKEFVDANEPRLRAYNVYFNADGSRMTVIHIHPDAASLEFHMNVAGHLFPKFAEFVRMVRIDIYGEPGEHVVEKLRQKTEGLGSGTVHVHQTHTGVSRSTF